MQSNNKLIHATNYQNKINKFTKKSQLKQINQHITIEITIKGTETI